MISLAAGLLGSVAGGGTTTSPSPIVSPNGVATIRFDGLSGNGAPLHTYTESGFTVSAMSGDWSVRAEYGHPAPFIQFRAANATVIGEVQIRASGPVYFKSVDLYSSTRPIPYTIKGLRDGSIVFTAADTLPNTFGDFRTIFNPRGADA